MTLIVNELLCYMLAKIDSVPRDILTRLVNENFSDSEVDAAKNLLREYVEEAVKAGPKRGQNKKKHDLEDIIKMLILCDRSMLPSFVALDISKLPPISVDCIDVSSIMRKQQLQEIEICHLKDMVQDILSVTAETSKRLETGRFAQRGSPSGTATCKTDEVSTDSSSGSDYANTSLLLNSSVNEVVVSSEPSYSEVVRGAASSSDQDWSVANRKKRGKAPVPKRPAAASVDVSAPSTSADHQEVRPTASKTVIGSGKAGPIKAVAVVKRMSMFMSRLPPGTGDEAVRSYVKEQTGAEDVTATKLQSKYDSYESYRLDIVNPSSPDILDPQLWAQGLVVRRFFVKHQSTHRSHSDSARGDLSGVAPRPVGGADGASPRRAERK